MKKILMRGWMNPLETLTSEKVIANNMVGNNIGNLLFSHSVMRTLMCEDTIIDTVPTARKFTDQDVDFINSEYDCFVIPLANAFRISFKKELGIIRRLVKRLKIPCVVIGVGMQASIGGEIHADVDDEVKRFVKTIVKKSAMIGVRGEITGDYLKRLGFTPEKDYTVIGCPAMYMGGDTLNVKIPKELTPDSLVSVNRKPGVPGKVHEFIMEQSRQFHDYMYVPQNVDDLELLYAGTTLDEQKYNGFHPTYPWNVESEVYAGGHEIGFTNVKSWMDFLSQRDFSFGTRIHGNICAIMSGIPAFIFAPDARILELAQYHNIQHMIAKDITNETNIFDIYEKADFTSVQRGHKERFNHYLDFLEANGLEHVYGKERVNVETKFDRILKERTFAEPVMPLTTLSQKEQAQRMRRFKREVFVRKCAKKFGTSKVKAIRSMGK